MTGTVAVLSDIHGMLGPLDQVLAEPAVASADLVVVTGDHTWGPEPAEVLDRLVGPRRPSAPDPRQRRP
ncbi:putative phosphodiesterase [Streptomyces ambofaciens]